jgi:hypothetical protein
MDDLTADSDDDLDPRQAIARLEDQIEQLEAKLESCRKFAAAAKLAMVLGGVLLLGQMLGVVFFDALALIGAMAALIGGFVMHGSNSSTAKGVAAELAQAEADRATLIGSIELRTVESPALH